MSSKRRRKRATKRSAQNPVAAQATETSISKTQPFAVLYRLLEVLYQLLAVVIGFYATTWIVFDYWISSINDLAYKFGALEGSRGEMWGEVSDPVRISTILAGVTGGLTALLIVRSLMGLSQGRKSLMVKLLVAVTVLLGLATCLITMFVTGVAY